MADRVEAGTAIAGARIEIDGGGDNSTLAGLTMSRDLRSAQDASAD